MTGICWGGDHKPWGLLKYTNIICGDLARFCRSGFLRPPPWDLESGEEWTKPDEPVDHWVDETGGPWWFFLWIIHGSSMVDMFFSIIPKCWGGDNGHTAMMAAGLSLLVVGVFGFLSLCIYAAYMMPKWSAGGIPGHSIEQLPEPWLMCYFNGLCYPVRWELSWSIVGTPINQYKEITWPEIRWVIMFVELFLGEPWPQHLRTRLATKWGIVHEFAARDLYLTWCEIEETQNA